MRLFVGNLAFSTTDKDILVHFQGQGYKPIAVKLVTDRDTGRSRGFCFVDLSTEAEGNKALQLDGSDLAGRKLKVTVAEDKRNNTTTKPFRPAVPAKPAEIVTKPSVLQRPFPKYQEEPTNTYIEPNYQLQEYQEVGKERSRRKDQHRKKSRERNEEEDW